MRHRWLGRGRHSCFHLHLSGGFVHKRRASHGLTSPRLDVVFKVLPLRELATTVPAVREPANRVLCGIELLHHWAARLRGRGRVADATMDFQGMLRQKSVLTVRARKARGCNSLRGGGPPYDWLRAVGGEPRESTHGRGQTALW